MDTPPQPPENHWDVKSTHTITVMCSECGSLIEVKNPEAWILASHLAVCHEMTLLTGERD